MKQQRLFVCGLAILAMTAGAFAAPDIEQDILISYAQSYADSHGGEANTQATLAKNALWVNIIQEQSGTGARWHIAGFYKSNTETYKLTTPGGFVGWLANGDSRAADIVAEGNAVGADLVCHFVQYADSGALAVAQEPGRYSALNPGGEWGPVFAHETGGHNYGGHHEDGHVNPKTVMLHNYCGGGTAWPYYFSNPNIYNNGVQLTGDGTCTGGSMVNGGDNAWRIASETQNVSYRNARPIVGPVLDHTVLRWQFNSATGSAPAGTTIADSVSALDAVVRGNGATFTGSGLRIPGGTTGNTAANSIAAYIDLPNGILSSRTNLTIEIWATPLSAPNFARILDFGRTVQAGNGAPGEWTGLPGTAAPGTTESSDNIYLALARGTDISTQRFQDKLNGTAVSVNSDLITTAGVQHHYALTFTEDGSGGRWQWYRDGDAIGYLDVNHHLADIEDVNNWLGRSQWSSDGLANNEYAEVRISDVAMSPAQVEANYLLGPHYDDNANVMMTAGDDYGTTSFNVAGHWSSGSAPAAGNTYETFGYWLRTPATGSAYTFGGDALKMSGGALVWKGTGGSTVTINGFTLNGGTVLNAGAGTCTLAGSLNVVDEILFRGDNGPINVVSDLSGDGSVLCLENRVTLSGDNSGFAGKVLVGKGRSGSLTLSSEAQLGSNPSAFSADQLTLNRGWLYTTSSLTIDDSNRGVRIGVSGGFFNVAPGTTLTIDTPVSSPTMPSGVAGLLTKENSGTLVLTNPDNTHNGPISINSGTFRIDGAGRLGSGSYGMPIQNNAAFIDDSSANQTLSGSISGSGTLTKGGSGALTLSGANTMSGAVTVNEGILYANPGNAANNRALSYVSGIMVNSNATLQSGINGLFGSDGTQEHPITVNPGGILTCNAGANVGVSTVTLAGGTLANLGASTANGSWRFDQASDQLVVTDDSTLSAVNVKFGSPAAYIDVASGKTLDVTGTITDATSGGTSYLTLSNGSGTVLLSGANTYTGATTVNSGTLLVNGSIGSSAITIGSNGSLGGYGTMGGSVTVQSGGNLTPGASIGSLTVSGDVTLEAGSTAFMEIRKLPNVNDVLDVGGTLTLGGTLVVTNLAGTLEAGDSFKLFDAGSITGDFSAYVLPDPGTGMAWSTQAIDKGIIRIVSTESTDLMLEISSGDPSPQIMLSWPATHTGWLLQYNADSLTNSSAWYPVSNSAMTNVVTSPLSPFTNVFFRLVYP